MNNTSTLTEFISQIFSDFNHQSLVKLSLANYQGSEPSLKKCKLKLVLVKEILMLSATYQYQTKDITKNYDAQQIPELLNGLLAPKGFRNAVLQNTTERISLNFLKENNWKISREKIEANMPDLQHDKSKTRALKPDRNYLQILGISSSKGEVYQHAQDKFKQINHYIELISPALKNLKSKKIRVADMGSGKGYLTFALYDYLQQQGFDAEVIGLEARQDLVDFCNDTAKACGFKNLRFERGYISAYQTSKSLDILIALHACDTATDDAIWQGIKQDAALIITAPCCHKQIRKEISKGNANKHLEPILRHGILLERQAEMATDALRALILEYAGYRTKIMQFISDQHTPKNLMILAEKTNRKKEENLQKIAELKQLLGIQNHYLEALVGI